MMYQLMTPEESIEVDNNVMLKSLAFSKSERRILRDIYNTCHTFQDKLYFHNKYMKIYLDRMN